jgi:hypothetical protein
MRNFTLAFASIATALLISSAAQAQSFPCHAFQMLPNGMLAVIQPVTISNPNGARVSMNPGTSFGPGTQMAGLNVFALYQQNCR